MAGRFDLHHDKEVMAHCVNAYMSHIRDLRAAIEDIEEEIREKESSLTLMGVDYSGMQGAPQSSADKLPDGVIGLLDLRERLADEHAAAALDIAYARALCRGSEDLRVLWLSKVERLTYAEIAARTLQGQRTVRRRADHGVSLMYYLMPEEWRRDPIPNAQVGR